jgi:hypothetical protein
MMHARRMIVAAFLLALVQFGATSASARSCITTVAGDTCLATCIGDLEEVCGSDPVCHQDIAAALEVLASTPAGTPLCEAAVENALAVCDCD